MDGRERSDAVGVSPPSDLDSGLGMNLDLVMLIQSACHD